MSSNPPEIVYDADSYASTLPGISIYQSDDRIFHGKNLQYDEVTGIGAVSLEGQTFIAALELSSGEQARLRVRVLDEAALRVDVTLPGSSPIEETSDMLFGVRVEAVAVALEALEGSYRLSFGQRTLVLEKSPFAIKVLDDAEQVIFETEAYPLAGAPMVGALGFRRAPDASAAEPYLSWKLRNNERFFGLGEKWNKVEKRSTRATIWASDTCGSNSNDLTYKSLPYLLSTRGWGMFLHSSFRSFWEIGSFSYVSGSCLTEDDKLDAFLFFGDDLKALIRKFTDLTGRPKPIPDWALGVWVSRCQYRSAEETEEAMDGMRARGIPADVIHLDPLWMRTHYYFAIGVDACDFEKNEEKFPDLPGLWKKWRKNGYKTCLWINPYLPEGTEIHAHAAKNGYLLQSTKGGVARLSHGQPVGMIDFTNPDAREWWKGKLKELLAAGAAVLKPDYGDRVPEDALFYNGKTGRELHNMYLFWYTETCYQACQEVHDYGLVWRRAGYIGSQRYPGSWAGDTRSTWEEMLACMRGGLSAGFGGEAFWAGDIGGFTGPKPTPELYIRWAQWGLLSPLSRFHAGNGPREPWHFGDQAVEVVRRYAKLRYRLIPYLKKCAEAAYQEGLPIMRHMHLEFPHEGGTDTIDDQYMLGSYILVAPIFDQGASARDVYFPAGTWIHLEDEHVSFTGPRWHRVEAPLERIPVFRLDGATIPVDETERTHLD